MKGIIKHLVLLTITAHAACKNIDLQTDIKKLSNTNTSIYIYDLKNNKDIIKNNADSLFIPASIQKLATAYAALTILGEDFRFYTDIRYRGKISNRTLTGDIWLDFSGDPTLTSEDLKSMLQKIKTNKIDSIEGSIYINNKDFDSQIYGPGWMWDELDDCYAAPIAATIIDGNCTVAHVWPNKKANYQAHFKLEDELDQPVYHNIYTNNNPQQKCNLTFKRNNPNYYFLTGCINQHSSTQNVSIAAHDPNSNAIKKIRALLSDVKISHNGNIVFNQTTSKDKKLLARHKSKPLEKIVITMLKDSDNLIAESLFKKAGQITFNQPGSWANGHDAISYALAKQNLPFSESQLQDGSGLSRYNLMSAKQIISLLKHINNSTKHKKTIISGLPLAGIDGTLMWINSPALIGQVHAKTGSMTGVYNLAGFFSTLTSDYAFVILINGPPQKNKSYRKTAEKALNTAILSL
ncbi:MAG: D-alanyl-D-alanine carboxypeptidase/D-alanyl-D-alanine-endopeptidase [Legionellales bacterium]|nr:D-alanyl-D-alanine carboxypeptidase/D-alanyl-D-alanine-endopeptidase [Legionellales bacterium]